MKSGKIINKDFHDLLAFCRDAKGRPYTVSMLAEAVRSERSHVTRVLNNTPPLKGQRFGQGRGGRTRRKLAAFILCQFPVYAPAMLAALGWDRDGNLICAVQSNIVPRGECHVAHKI